jgi:predicted RNase H-like nuclease (RuvC/YqgF family)
MRDSQAEGEINRLSAALETANARTEGLEERLDWQAQNMVKMVDEAVASLRAELVASKAENERLRNALEAIIVNGDYTAPEGMKRIAKQAIAPECETCGGRGWVPVRSSDGTDGATECCPECGGSN